MLGHRTHKAGHADSDLREQPVERRVRFGGRPDERIQVDDDDIDWVDAVLLDGRADLAAETQNLRVLVVPELNAGGASLAYAAINPAIGPATFLAQLVLSRPMAAANTREFHITGSWDDPKVEKVEHKPLPEAKE